jgi:hypothetical protein
MNKAYKHWLALGVFLALLLSGCKCTEDQFGIMEIILDSPAAGELVSSLLPSLSWHNSESCQPDSYHIYLKENYQYSPGASYTTPDDNPSLALSGAPLDPFGSSDWSESALFYTGPVCSGEPLIAPELQDPGPAGWVEHEYDFNWTYTGGCLPLGYDVQFAWDAAFNNIYLTASPSDPYAQHLLMAFPDCSSLFWRVRAKDGTTTGPWSEGRDFHYILTGGCYQWHYLSDDFAWINVRIAKDYCDQTGFLSSTTSSLHSGCVPDGAIIVGDGSSYSYLGHFVADLGAGPCPSTGLDQKTADWQATFGVLTPGTYCVSVSRNQIAGYDDDINMMDGVWTVPRVKAVVVEETLTLGPGVQDIVVEFHWDKIEKFFFRLPLNYTMACKLGPDDQCNTYGFAAAGELTPIFARDRTSDWKLSEINGTPCYIKLGNAAINEMLGEYQGLSWRAEDLAFFPDPGPCPKPEQKPSTTKCSDYTNETACIRAGCDWQTTLGTTAGGYCTDK